MGADLISFSIAVEDLSATKSNKFTSVQHYNDDGRSKVLTYKNRHPNGNACQDINAEISIQKRSH